MSAAGDLQKIKLSPRNVVFERSAVEAYINERMGVLAGGLYSSPSETMEQQCEGGIVPGVAEAIDCYLAPKFPGLLIWTSTSPAAIFCNLCVTSKNPGSPEIDLSY
jgi:hypothetical protein